MYFSTLHGEPAMINRLSYWVGDTESAKAFLNAPVAELISGDVTEGSGRNKREIHFSNALDELDNGKNKKAASEDKQSNVKPSETAQTKQMTKADIVAIIQSMPESVAVLNGTGKNGVSSEIATRLQQLGIDVVHSGNAKHFDYEHNNVIYPTNASEGVKKTAQILGGFLNIPKNLIRPSRQAFYASVIAGHDYKKLVAVLDDMLKIAAPQQTKQEG